MDAIKIAAPCKINLHLNVGSKGDDGYHHLESIFLPLSLCDILRLEPLESADSNAEKPALFLDCDYTFPAAHKITENSVARAVQLFRAQTGLNFGVKIKRTKNIPLGSGLGGGSTDAAATLNALNTMSGFPLDGAALHRCAAQLGSDVPFFMEHGAALVRGRGEQVERFAVTRPFSVILIYPGFHSATAAAYSLVDQYQTRYADQAADHSTPPLETLAAALNDGNTKLFHNDFLDAFLALSPKNEQDSYRSMIDLLRVNGAEFAGLSGSGSCCFGLFFNKAAAQNAEHKVAQRWDFVRLTGLFDQNAGQV